MKHNQKVTCEIDGIKITDARISINKDGSPFICQNEQLGAHADDKLGYKYSWGLMKDFTDFAVTDLSIEISLQDIADFKGVDVESIKII